MNRMATIDDLKIERRATQPPRKGRRFPVVVVLVVAIAALGGTAYLLWGHFFARPAEKVQPVVTSTAPPAETASGAGFSAGGYLEVIPPGPVVVSTIVDGRVESIKAVEGQAVEAGQEVARLDDSLHRRDVEVRESAVALARAKLARLEAGFRPEEIEQAKADLEKARARRDQAQVEFDRLGTLVDRSAVSRKEYDDARFVLAAARADVASRSAEYELRKLGTRKEDIAVARAELAAAQAELDRAKWRLDNCIIKSPQSGLVLEQFAHVGDWLSQDSGRLHATAILSIVDPKRIQAWVDVNQRDIGRVFVGQQATLATDANPSGAIRGRVAQILPKANLQKNTVQAKIEIPDPPPDLRPEMSVKVTFLPREKEQRSEVPGP